MKVTGAAFGGHGGTWPLARKGEDGQERHTEGWKQGGKFSNENKETGAAFREHRLGNMQKVKYSKVKMAGLG
jgi:hypothetical protein